MNCEIFAHILIWVGFGCSLIVSSGKENFRHKWLFRPLVFITILCECIAIPMMIYYLFK